MYRVVQREAWLLLLLVLLAVPAFLFTRSFASKIRATQMQGAATWYTRGEASLRQGDSKAAIRYFRQAASANHENNSYSLALANALAREGRNEEAQRLLLQLREDEPESAAINLQLGRLAAREGNMGQAVLHYHHALYGRWPDGEPDSTRVDVRKELIRLMLLHRDFDAAISELLILVQELPRTAPEMTEAGQFFLTAGDARSALRQFQSALNQQRDFGPALAGAGEANFTTGDYAAARRYFQRAASAGATSDRIRHLARISELVLANDPMMPRLSEAQRSKRLLADFNFAYDHLEDCAQKHSGLDDLQSEAESMRTALKGRDVLHDPAMIDSTLSWIGRAEEAVVRECGTGDLKQALLLISRRSGGRSAE